MNIAVGLMERRQSVDVELGGAFFDGAGKKYTPGRHRLKSGIVLTPSDAESAWFAIDDVTIGIGFHWQRKERQVFQGGLRILERDGLTVINDVDLEDYITSVISSEMSAACPPELLKAHAVISRSWLLADPLPQGEGGRPPGDEVIRWYGRQTHTHFNVCADDHCQRYQGTTKAFSPSVVEAVHATAGQLLLYNDAICDARFSKCCGGLTENYSTAWEDCDFPYLVSIYDGPGVKPSSRSLEDWILSRPPAYCDTAESSLISAILPGFDQETRDFYRWTATYSQDELSSLVNTKLGFNLGTISGLEPLERGASGRIVRLKISGSRNSVVVGKELEIRRVLSPTHLYSSAFLVERDSGRFVLHGAGWGHGVGLCQIGAAVMAAQGHTYPDILTHYYPNTSISSNR